MTLLRLIRRSRMTGHVTHSPKHFHTTHFHPARILCSEPLDPNGLASLQAHGHHVDVAPTTLSPDELEKSIANYDGLIVNDQSLVSAAIIQAGVRSKLQLIGRTGPGLNNIDLLSATKHRVLVMNAPTAHDNAIVEYAQGLILSLQTSASPLMGKTVGIIGLGSIGQEFARRCKALGMHVVGHDLCISDSASKARDIMPVPDLNDLLRQSDYLSLHLPLTVQTSKFLNGPNLAKCKDGVKIINCAHADLIDYVALSEGLLSGKVSAVALDGPFPSGITSSEKKAWKNVIQHPKSLISPGIRAHTIEAQANGVKEISAAMSDVFDRNGHGGANTPNVVNGPHVHFGLRRPQQAPYLSLAEQLGSLHAQLLQYPDDRIKRIVILTQGHELYDDESEIQEHIVTGVLKGLLDHAVEDEVYFCNARAVADKLGLHIEEHRERLVSDEENYANQIKVSLYFENPAQEPREISGTCFGLNHELRVTKINQMRTDFTVPSKSLLFFNNTDKPGILLTVTDRLAHYNSNIASFCLGRDKSGGTAVGILTLDDVLDQVIIDELQQLPDISNVRPVHLAQDMPFIQGEQSDSCPKVEEMTEAEQARERENPKPTVKPSSPNFGSGPCKKRPGYSLTQLNDRVLGRSHRSKLGKARLKEAIDQTKRILGLPSDYVVGIVPASDTGAFEMAMWNLLGPRPVDICYWEAFGKGWYQDATEQLQLKDVTQVSAEYGELPDFQRQTNARDHDICLTWNGTTSGVCVPNGDWIPDDRKGLILNDATSAAFAMDIPWSKVDVTTFSWQKVLGGEGGHGMVILSPRALERLETFTPENRPMPKIFRFSKGLYEGSTINTPSMLCVEDYLDALKWVDEKGGLEGIVAHSKRNLLVLEDFVAKHDWIHFLAADLAIRSNTSVCLLLDDLSPNQLKQFLRLLEDHEVAFDIASYRDAPAGLRIWCGATVETKDLEALCPWLEWAYAEVKYE